MAIGLGGYVIGSEAPVEGRIRNLNIYQNGPDGIQLTYIHEGYEEGEHHALLYINGRLASIDATGVANATGLSEGYQNINLVPQLESSPISDIFFDEQDGRRVLLTWQASDQDIAGYRIYQVDLDGTNPVLIGTVSDRLSTVLNRAYPHIGGGQGRISAPAVVLPSTAFGHIEIEITGNHSATWSYNEGPANPIIFSKGQLVYISDFNIPILFDDDFEEYVTGDTWVISTGIYPYFLTSDLEPGSYRYAIQAHDAYGNESDLTLTDIFEVVEHAEPVVDEIVTWDDGKLYIDYRLPSGASSVRLYSNYLTTEGEFQEYVQIQATDTGTGSDIVNDEIEIGTGFEIDFGENEGVLLYYLMPVTSNGDELQDFSLRTVNVPPQANDMGIILGTPENLSARPVGVQNWEIDWEYYIARFDTATQFTIHRVTEGNPFTLDENDLVASIPFDSDGHSGYVEELSYTHDSESLPAGTLEICVVAHNANGDTTVSDSVQVVTRGSVIIDQPQGIIGGTV